MNQVKLYQARKFAAKDDSDRTLAALGVLNTGIGGNDRIGELRLGNGNFPNAYHRLRGDNATVVRNVSFPDKSGIVAFLDDLTVPSLSGVASVGNSTSLRIRTSGYDFDGNRGGIEAGSDGVFILKNNAGSGFSRLCFGGAGSTFPSLVRDPSGAAFLVRTADNASYCTMQMSGLYAQDIIRTRAAGTIGWSGDTDAAGALQVGFSRLSSTEITTRDNSANPIHLRTLFHRAGAGSPEGIVVAPIGAIYSRTDGGAGSSVYVKESGSGNTGWVAK